MREMNFHNSCRSAISACLMFRKVDAATGIGLPGRAFRLAGCQDTALCAVSDEAGVVTFHPLCPGEYVLMEEPAPPADTPVDLRYIVRVDSCGCIWVNGKRACRFVICNAPQPELLGAFQVYKTNPGGTPLFGAVYTLIHDGVEASRATTDKSGLASFLSVPPGIYSLVEAEPPAGYTPNMAVSTVVVADGTVMINDTLTDLLTVIDRPILTSLSGEKIWEDGGNLYGTRPSSVAIVLLQNGAAFCTAEIDAFGSNTFLFENLPKFDNAGVEFIYTVDELTTPPGYIKTISGTTISNTLAVTVITGDWTSYGNYLAVISNNSFMGYFGSPVIEAGVHYAQNDPAFTTYLSSAAYTPTSPFMAYATSLANGIWYYRAYVKTTDGRYYFGDVKSAAYP